MKINKETILKALDLYDKGLEQESIDLLYPFIVDEDENNFNEELNDVLMEAYTFITLGDLRPEGREIGFKNTEEIRNEINKFN
jgi:hypothetical protein